MGDPGARALADLAWAAQDSFLRATRHILLREEEFSLVGPLPRAGTPLTSRTAVRSAEPRTSPSHGTVTRLVVTTELAGPGGSLIAVSTSTILLGAGAWKAALVG